MRSASLPIGLSPSGTPRTDGPAQVDCRPRHRRSRIARRTNGAFRSTAGFGDLRPSAARHSPGEVHSAPIRWDQSPLASERDHRRAGQGRGKIARLAPFANPPFALVSAVPMAPSALDMLAFNARASPAPPVFWGFFGQKLLASRRPARPVPLPEACADGRCQTTRPHSPGNLWVIVSEGKNLAKCRGRLLSAPRPPERPITPSKAVRRAPADFFGRP